MSDDKEGPILFICGGKKEKVVKLRVEVPKTLFDRYVATMGGKTTNELFADFMRYRLYGPPSDDPPPRVA